VKTKWKENEKKLCLGRVGVLLLIVYSLFNFVKKLKIIFYINKD